MKRSYHTINKQGKANEQKLAEFLSKDGQLLLPMVDLIEQCRMAFDQRIDVARRATIQAVLDLSAQQVAGASQQGPSWGCGLEWPATWNRDVERPQAGRPAKGYHPLASGPTCNGHLSVLSKFRVVPVQVLLLDFPKIRVRTHD